MPTNWADAVTSVEIVSDGFQALFQSAAHDWLGQCIDDHVLRILGHPQDSESVTLIGDFAIERGHLPSNTMLSREGAHVRFRVLHPLTCQGD
jgi:ketosteroid isomerase-like protein